MSPFKIIVPPLLLIGVIVGACRSGQMMIPLQDLWQAFLSIFDNRPQSNAEVVLWNIRLPRIAAGVVVGMALSAAGATYQGMFKNPLVSPDILGVTAGAGFGAVMAIYFDLPLFAIQAAAFCGGLSAVSAVYLIARSVRRQDIILTLVLSGVAVSALLGAGISLLKILSDPYGQLSSIIFWLLGGLNMVTFEDLRLIAPLVLLGLLPLILLRWRMNLLSLNDDEASALGISPKYYRLVFISSATLITSATVSITGIIGWVGLIIPHIARLWIGADFRLLLPTTLFTGAAFLVLTDAIARSVFVIEIPLGIITAFVGAPFFLALLMFGRR